MQKIFWRSSDLLPLWKKGSRLKIVTNAGGLNPIGCAKACSDIIRDSGFNSLKIGVVYGDDVLSLITTDADNPQFNNLETNDPIRPVISSLVTANAYLGSRPIVEALTRGADIVITGRVADPSLTAAPCIAHFGWSWRDYDHIAGATIAGHLIECGTQVTGGISTNWLDVPDPANIGFPIVEVMEDGSCIVTKPENTGGQVTLETVKEQLLYEIGDPNRYLSPDATVSFLSLQLKSLGKDRVQVSDAKGAEPPLSYKVSATYRDGFKTEGFLTLFGPDAAKKAKLCGEIILEKVRKAGYKIDRSLIECLGCGDVVPGIAEIPKAKDSLECVLRVCVASHQQEALEYFAREIASMVTSGPQGVTGYTSGRPQVRPVFAFWPCLIDPAKVTPTVNIIEVSS